MANYFYYPGLVSDSQHRWLADILLRPDHPKLAVQFGLAIDAGSSFGLLARCGMSLRLERAISKLVTALEMAFSPSGTPAKPAMFLYPLEEFDSFDHTTEDKLNARFAEAKKPEVCTLTSFLASPPHPLISEVVERVAPLEEVASALRAAAKTVEQERRDEAALMCCAMFDALCDWNWFEPSDSNPVLRKSKHGASWGYRVQEIDCHRLLRLLREAQKTVGRNLATALELDNDEKEVIALLHKVGHRLTTKGVLDEFNRLGQIKAESTTKTKLALMVKKGALTKDATAKPAGYGLPEWN